MPILSQVDSESLRTSPQWLSITEATYSKASTQAHTADDSLPDQDDFHHVTASRSMILEPFIFPSQSFCTFWTFHKIQLFSNCKFQECRITSTREMEMIFFTWICSTGLIHLYRMMSSTWCLKKNMTYLPSWWTEKQNDHKSIGLIFEVVWNES